MINKVISILKIYQRVSAVLLISGGLFKNWNDFVFCS